MTTERSLDELLLAHAAGKLAAPVALLVETHLALSPASRRCHAIYEAIGGALLEGIEAEPLQEAAWERISARLAQMEEKRPPLQEVAGEEDILLPIPLRRFLPRGLDGLSWRTYGNIAEADLDLGSPEHRARFFRLKAGRSVPQHTHGGQELTLVIQGSFSDKRGHYRRGDVAIADPSIDHRPRADEGEDCLCFTVTDAPLKLTGPIGRLLNPFLRV
jgi:putative transcriptional regulator